MEIPQALAQEALLAIKKAAHILIISHRNPDADTIGSNLALRQVFERYGKKVTSACVDKVPEGLTFLKNFDQYVQNFDLSLVDLIVCVDAGSKAQVAFSSTVPELFDGAVPLINIDHHASNEHYGTINFVYPEAASASIVVYFLLKTWQEKFTENIATCLLYGLYYDTGSFMHSNTNDEVYDTASELLKLGAKLDPIIKNLFHNQSIEQLKLWGKVLSEAQVTEKDIVVAGISQEDFKNTQTKNSDLSGAINYLSMVKNNLFAAILSEDEKGNIRGSLRTRHDHVNLSEIAGLLGGGGHKKASGFTFQGKLKKEVKWTIQ